MPADSPTRAWTPDDLPLAVVRRIDLLCDEYEAGRREGQRPDLTDFLTRVPPEAQDTLREELAAVEAECCCLDGANVPAVQVADRFGVAAEAVRTWVGRLDRALLDTPSAPPLTPPQTPAAAAAPDDPALPCPFGEYELVAKLGEGGMGAVYKARHRRLGRDVALKLIRAHDAGGRLAARFEREMQAAGRLDHPHVVEAQHAGEHEGQLFLTMKLLDGLDLARLVRQAGPLRPADACEAVRQAALGLQYIHVQGLVHRDLKPANLMLTTSGSVKILDLGLARLANPAAGEQELTGRGMTLGTVDYMAPEQQTDPAGVTIAADLYGLGCVLYHLLAGQPPFAGRATVRDKLIAHQVERPPDLRALRPGLPEEVVRVVERLLAKAPADRPAQPRDVAAALAPLTAGADLTALAARGHQPEAPAREPHQPEAPAREPYQPDAPARDADRPSLALRAGMRRRWPVAAAVVLGVACVAGLGVLAVRRLPPAPDQASPAVAAVPKAEAPAQRPLAVRSLRVSHFLGGTDEAQGDIGVRSFGTQYGDKVRVTAELSERASCYLLALNPNGAVQLCWPERETTPPEPGPRVVYPAAGQAFTLNDEPKGGMQAFVLVASRQPLPAYAEWRTGLGPLPWRRLPPPRVVWRGDGEALDPVLPGGGNLRGRVEELKGVGPLAETARGLRAAAGVEAVAVLAFPVTPGAGN